MTPAYKARRVAKHAMKQKVVSYLERDIWLTSLHEAGHAVGHWLMGGERRVGLQTTIESMCIPDDHITATTGIDGSTTFEDDPAIVEEWETQWANSTVDYVDACERIFIELSGLIAPMACYGYEADNEFVVRDHFNYVLDLCSVARMTEAQADRIDTVVRRTFTDPRIKHVTMILANRLYDRRYLDGKEVMNIIQTAYTGYALPKGTS